MTKPSKDTGGAPSMEPALEDAGKESQNVIRDLRDMLLAAASDAHQRGQEEWPYVTDELDKWLDLLDARGEAVADEARLQAHLGLMEASERAAALEQSVADAFKAVKDKGKPAKAAVEEAGVQAHLMRLDAEDAVRERAARLRGVVKEASRTVTHPVLAAEKELVRIVQTWASLYH